MPLNPHEYLNAFTNYESQLHQLRPEDFTLYRIQKFLDLAGHPAKHLKIVHVAGTKGKGSTCAMLAAILQEAGYKVGLYTSPHLHKVNERIAVNGTLISDEEMASVLNFLRPHAARIINDGSFITYFEIITVMALSFFARKQVDIVILETGLGGRLDATNAVESMLAVITPISLDHMQILGDTLGKIATEKAGIIKDSQQKVVIAPQVKEAMDVLQNRCQEFGIKPVVVDAQKYKGIKVGLKGPHQIINAAVAIEAVNILRTLGFNINEEAQVKGLKDVRWSGRFEWLRAHPDVIVDCAHNEASAQALAQTLVQEYPRRRVILILGISKDKDVAAICRQLKDSAGHFILTKAKHPRAYEFKPDEAKKLFAPKTFDIIPQLSKALETALQKAGPDDVIVIAGSVFVVAEAMEEIKHVSV